MRAVILTPKGYLKARYPKLLGPHEYIGCGPKGGGGCIDCGYCRNHVRHSLLSKD